MKVTWCCSGSESWKPAMGWTRNVCGIMEWKFVGKRYQTEIRQGNGVDN